MHFPEAEGFSDTLYFQMTVSIFENNRPPTNVANSILLVANPILRSLNVWTNNGVCHNRPQKMSERNAFPLYQNHNYFCHKDPFRAE